MENQKTIIERKILELNIRLQSLLVNSGNAPVSELFGIEKKEINIESVKEISEELTEISKLILRKYC